VGGGLCGGGGGGAWGGEEKVWLVVGCVGMTSISECPHPYSGPEKEKEIETEGEEGKKVPLKKNGCN